MDLDLLLTGDINPCYTMDLEPATESFLFVSRIRQADDTVAFHAEKWPLSSDSRMECYTTVNAEVMPFILTHSLGAVLDVLLTYAIDYTEGN